MGVGAIDGGRVHVIESRASAFISSHQHCIFILESDHIFALKCIKLLEGDIHVKSITIGQHLALTEDSERD